LVFHAVLTSRVGRLVSVARWFSAGEGSIRSGIVGRDEVSDLARAVDRMLDEIVAARRRLEESERTVRRSFENERGARARAQEAVRARDEFLSIASHELRTPITALQLQLDGLDRIFTSRAATDPSRLVDRLTVTRRQVKRLDALITNMLDISRISL